MSRMERTKPPSLSSLTNAGGTRPSTDKPAPEEKQSKGLGIFSNPLILHVIVEVVVLIGVVYYFQTKISKLNKKVEELQTTLTKHDEILRMIVTRLGNDHPHSLPPPLPSQPAPQEQKARSEPKCQQGKCPVPEEKQDFQSRIEQEVVKLEMDPIPEEDDDGVEQEVDITQKNQSNQIFESGVNLVIMQTEPTQSSEEVQFISTEKNLKQRRRSNKSKKPEA